MGLALGFEPTPVSYQIQALIFLPHQWLDSVNFYNFLLMKNFSFELKSLLKNNKNFLT